MDSSFNLRLNRGGWWIGLLVILSSCETLVGIVPESRIGKQKAQLVVHCYLSAADTLIKVFVSRSTPVFSDKPANPLVEDALVTLGDGSREETLRYDPTLQVYTLLPEALGGIRAGKTYYLKVSRGDEVLQASTTIPQEPPAISSYQVDSSYTSGGIFGDYDTTLAVRYTWKDIPGSGHYYRTSGRALVELAYREYDLEGNMVIKEGLAWVPLSWDRSFGRRDLQSDINEDGHTMESPLGRVTARRATFVDGISRDHSDKPSRVLSMTLELLLTDEVYYRYHRSVEQNEDAAENPFAEPALLYSNVSGGLGIFASFNSFSIDIKP